MLGWVGARGVCVWGGVRRMKGCCRVLRGPFPKGTFLLPCSSKAQPNAMQGAASLGGFGCWEAEGQRIIVPSTLAARNEMNSANVFLLAKFQHLDSDDDEKLSISVK